MAAAVTVALLATSASGTDIVGSDPAGDLKGARGLTKKERRALDIVSVRVSGEEGLGLFVTVTLKGNVQQAIGRGHLKDALVALILRPEPGVGAPAGLVTAGPGLIGETLRKTKSSEIAVVRRGRTVRFLILGPGFANVDSIEVKTFARAPAAVARNPSGIGGYLWPAILRAFGLDDWVHELADEVEELSCPGSRELQGRLREGTRRGQGLRESGRAAR